jgi:hypothetical protein
MSSHFNPKLGNLFHEVKSGSSAIVVSQSESQRK